ncbi:probable serine/threonine-protein kinase clkA [Bacillus rossius redtenbacheri]|uniref:probable serine/threonine-protein kinase clkA n=1 Tax=Bacillus rossius redtenbacheri TaxID=93214 RepID=UPI002FDCBAF7
MRRIAQLLAILIASAGRCQNTGHGNHTELLKNIFSKAVEDCQLLYSMYQKNETSDSVENCFDVSMSQIREEKHFGNTNFSSSEDRRNPCRFNNTNSNEKNQFGDTVSSTESYSSYNKNTQRSMPPWKKHMNHEENSLNNSSNMHVISDRAPRRNQSYTSSYFQNKNSNEPNYSQTYSSGISHYGDEKNNNFQIPTYGYPEMHTGYVAKNEYDNRNSFSTYTSVPPIIVEGWLQPGSQNARIDLPQKWRRTKRQDGFDPYGCYDKHKTYVFPCTRMSHRAAGTRDPTNKLSSSNSKGFNLFEWHKATPKPLDTRHYLGFAVNKKNPLRENARTNDHHNKYKQIISRKSSHVAWKHRTRLTRNRRQTNYRHNDSIQAVNNEGLPVESLIINLLDDNVKNRSALTALKKSVRSCFNKIHFRAEEDKCKSSQQLAECMGFDFNLMMKT